MQEESVLEIDDLPEILKQIAEWISLDAALAMLQVPHEKIYIPKKLHQDHYLVQLLGDDSAIKLCAHFGGARISVPKGRSRKIQRDCSIFIDSESLSIPQLAVKYKLSERQILRLLALSRSDERRGDKCRAVAIESEP